MRFRPKFVRKFLDFHLVLFGYYENQGKLAYMIKEKKIVLALTLHQSLMVFNKVAKNVVPDK